MIHYALRCSRAHEFDGWFKDSQSFDRQAALGLLVCPVCADTTVSRGLMAPAVSTRRERPPRPAAAPESAAAAGGSGPAPPLPAAAGPTIPDQQRAMLHRLRQEVERRCTYVGDGFAEEARRIHRGESEQRGIYGEASPEQAEALAEEGIEIARIPWLPLADS